jgi:hypothetical protein
MACFSKRERKALDAIAAGVDIHRISHILWIRAFNYIVHKCDAQLCAVNNIYSELGTIPAGLAVASRCSRSGHRARSRLCSRGRWRHGRGAQQSCRQPGEPDLRQPPSGWSLGIAGLWIGQHPHAPEALLLPGGRHHPVSVGAHRLCDVDRQHFHNHHPSMHDSPPHLRFA